MEAVRIYDTTLRDGMQREGISLSVGEQVRLAHVLDRLGFHVLEAGFPASNPKDAALFTALERDPPARATVAAFGMTRRREVAADADVGLRQLANCFAPITTLVGKTWDLHLEKVVRVSRDENLRMIHDSVAFLHRQGKRVFYDAEHFFDGYASDQAYALRCLRTAVDGGAEAVIVCDTNGATLPSRLAEVMRDVVADIGVHVEVGIHTHNDAECAVANSIVAVEAGARQVQGTVNGYGERCGNANLVSIVPGLQLKLGYRCVDDDDLRRLTRLSHEAAEIVNLAPDTHAAYVGRFAFGHKGGMHVAGIQADPETFEHLEPGLVGNARHVLVSELSGRATVRDSAAEVGLDLDDAAVDRVLEQLKTLEHQGYAFEAAEASFELLLRREGGEIEPLFELESFRVQVEKTSSGDARTEAVVKLRVAGRRVLAVGEGNGPVHALDQALRSALEPILPGLDRMELSNYTVRILDPASGTGAITRVILSSADATDEWSTVGVSPNIIEASWWALCESLTYGVRIRAARNAPTSA